jgi:hypothetical protein
MEVSSLISKSMSHLHKQEHAKEPKIQIGRRKTYSCAGSTLSSSSAMFMQMLLWWARSAQIEWRSDRVAGSKPTEIPLLRVLCENRSVQNMQINKQRE